MAKLNRSHVLPPGPNCSPGLDFETRLFAKTNAVERLREELARPGYVPQQTALGINTDAYQPIERRYGITRAVLELFAEKVADAVTTDAAILAGFVAGDGGQTLVHHDVVAGLEEADRTRPALARPVGRPGRRR